MHRGLINADDFQEVLGWGSWAAETVIVVVDVKR